MSVRTSMSKTDDFVRNNGSGGGECLVQEDNHDILVESVSAHRKNKKTSLPG